MHKIKKRETFNDLMTYDPATGKWEDLHYLSKLASQRNMSYINEKLVNPRKRNIEAGNVGEPIKRMSHASAILGNILFLYGGLYGEENFILDDLAVYDMGIRMWIAVK